MHVIQVVYLFANCAALRGYLARRPAAPSAEAELELAPVALPANHGLKVAQGVFVEGEIIEGEVVRRPAAQGPAYACLWHRTQPHAFVRRQVFKVTAGRALPPNSRFVTSTRSSE